MTTHTKTSQPKPKVAPALLVLSLFLTPSVTFADDDLPDTGVAPAHSKPALSVANIERVQSTLRNIRKTMSFEGAVAFEDADKVMLKLAEGDCHLALQWGVELVRFIGDWTRREGSQRLVDHCTQLVEQEGVNLQDLRENLRRIVADTRALVGLQEEDLIPFLDRLEGVYGQGVLNNPDIVEAVHNLRFLNSLNPSVGFSVRSWVYGFEPGLQRVEALAADPVLTYEGGILTFKGGLLGLAEMRQSYDHCFDVTRVDGLATYKLFIDSDFTAPGVSMSLIAPMWEVQGGPHTINLNGIAGRNGENGVYGTLNQAGGDGRPGEPGGNGGSFFGKGEVFQNIEQLSVTTAGGSGGNGGNGGAGGAGANGRDGLVGRVTYRTPKTHWCKTFKRRRLIEFVHFQDRGTNGKRGSRGGNAGRGGLGGYSSSNELIGIPWQPAIFPGVVGYDGQPGNGGIGGIHGRSCKGEHLVFHRVSIRDFRHMDPPTDEVIIIDRGVHHTEVRQAPGYQAPRGRAPNGANGGISAVQPAAPVQLLDIEGNARVDTYRVFKEDDAVAGNVQKVFPGLY